ncbi:NEL-type E3 ubiquitin ligase domain-containing protein [Pseudomonas putida]
MPQTLLPAKLEHATDQFIGEVLPDWLKSASPVHLKALRDAYGAHLQSQAKVAQVFSRLQAPEDFARLLLEDALHSKMALVVDLNKACWREERRKFSVPSGQLPTDESYFVTVPALQKLMQNFKSGESFYMETALVYPQDIAVGTTEEVLTKASSQLVSLCREVDAGGRYQQHLAQLFTADFQHFLAQDLRLTCALISEIAVTRRLLPQAELQVLRQIAQGQPPTHPQSDRVRCAGLRLLGCDLDAVLAVELSGSWLSPGGGPVISRRVNGVLLLIVDDPQQPVRHFVSWTAVNHFLLQTLAEPGRRGAFEQGVALQDRAGFVNTLNKRLADAEPDLQPSLGTINGELFADLAARQLQRIRADARFLLVPTAQADARQAAERLQMLQSAGLVMLNLAGLFVPGVGSLLLADMARRTLSQVCEGVVDWHLGHQHEALEHMLGVAETLAVNAAIIGGAKLVARGFTRSSFVDGLAPATLDTGEHRLWSQDLTRYEDASPPALLAETENGLLSDGSRLWWRHAGTHYRVRSSTANGPWRLLHPLHQEAFGPSLESNGEGAWRLSYERPLEWQGETLLLARLWPRAGALSAERVAQVLKVADVDEAHLRGLLVESRCMPVALRDTLERFAVAARIDGFFAALGSGDADSEIWQWCMTELAIQDLSLQAQAQTIGQQASSLRGPLLEHFSSLYLRADAQLAVLQRDFPGLPDAYALHLLQQITAEQRQAMRSAARIPLAVAQQARKLLQVARLTRMREGLYLEASYRPDVLPMVFALLRMHAQLPPTLNLQLREGSATGRLLAALHEPAPGALEVMVMVRDGSRFGLYEPTGSRLQIEVAAPEGLFETLVACLPQAHRARLGWAGEDAPQLLQKALQGWLPTGREALLQLLGMRDVGAPPNPLRRLPDGRVGYLLSGRMPGDNAPLGMLRARIRGLYPGFDEREVGFYLDILLQRPGSAYRNLLLQEQQYHRLREVLSLWVARARSAVNIDARRLAAREMRRNWRLIGERIVDQQAVPQGMRLSLVGMPLRSLPELPADTDFGHVAELVLMGLGIEQMPVSFLRCFSQLRWLNLSNNALRSIPPDLDRLRHLSNLRLANNQIRMTAPGVAMLRNLTRLQSLDLSFNPLGAISLQLRPLVRLRELNLRSANLLTVPTDLDWCGLLEVADLRDNHLSAMPQAMLDAPVQLRQALELGGNPLPLAIRQRMQVPEQSVQAPEEDSAQGQWLALLPEEHRQARGAQWDALRREPGSDDFFNLLSELTGTGDFRSERSDLGRRMWAMLEAASGDSELRTELFSLAGDPRTCVDSVASCFSSLEVRVYVAQILSENQPVMARAARLRLARQLFRLDQVQAIAREDIEARREQGRDADEVEVSLAYRTGLASELELPGQPRTMQFQTIAGVTQQQLNQASAAVRRAEASDELARFISQRDFWLEQLRREHANEFSEVEAPFWARLDKLSPTQAGSDGRYLELVNQLAGERKAAIEALALRLTREALGEVSGSGT